MRDTRHLPPETIGSFVEVDTPSLDTVDRSTLDRYATCPKQARLIEAGKAWLPTRPMAVGIAVHEAFSQAIQEHVDSNGSLNPSELAQAATDWLTAARPDVQPEAFQAAKFAVWPWTKLIQSIHVLNILRFDGGEWERSGQLAWDIEGLGTTPTAELDLLYAGLSKAVLHEIDYKSGRTHHTPSGVREAFQFQLHAWLVLNNYPEVSALECRVWDLRLNRLTWPVEFVRKDLEWITPRIRSTVGEWRKWKDYEIEDVPAWPEVTKCGNCPCATSCPAACVTEASDPASIPDLIAATEARLDKLKELAGSIVDATKLDLVSAAGNAYGFNKPASSRKKVKALYQVEPKEIEGEE